MKYILLFILNITNILLIHPMDQRILRTRKIEIDTLVLFKCTWPKCENKFATQDLLYFHIKAHEECDGKIFICHQCSKHFLQKKQLTAHLKTHDEKKELIKPDNVKALIPDQLTKLRKSKDVPEIPVLENLEEQMHAFITKRMAPLFGLLAENKPLTILHLKRKKPEQGTTPFDILRSVGEKNYKNIRHTYYCPECSTEFNLKTVYFEHLFKIHNYTYEPHIVSCKQAH